MDNRLLIGLSSFTVILFGMVSAVFAVPTINDVHIYDTELHIGFPEVFVNVTSDNVSQIVNSANFTVIVTVPNGTTYNRTSSMAIFNGTNTNGLWKYTDCAPALCIMDYPYTIDYYINVSDNNSVLISRDIQNFTIMNASPRFDEATVSKLFNLNSSEAFVFVDFPVIEAHIFNGRIMNDTINFFIQNETGVLSGNFSVDDSISSVGDGVISHGTAFLIDPSIVSFRKDYNLTIWLADIYGNSENYTIETIRFIEGADVLEHSTVLAYSNESNRTFLNSSITTNSSFDLKFDAQMNESISIAKYSNNPESVNFSSSALNKYVEILASQNFTDHLDWVVVHLYYTNQEVIDNGITESSLAFYIFNESTSQWEKVSGSGVNETGNYVFMNTTHFSTYGVFEEVAESAPAETVSSSGGGGGGGASGAIVQNPGQYVKKYSSLSPGIKRTITPFELEKRDLGVKEIEIVVSNKVNDVRITVVRLDGKPASVTHEVSGKVYRYIEIDHDNLLDNNVADANITFDVPRSWMVENEIDEETILLARFSNGIWEELPTEKVGENAGNVTYKANTPGFSVFAITTSISEEAAEEVEPAEEVVEVVETAEPVEEVVEVSNELENQLNTLLPIVAVFVLIGIVFGKRKDISKILKNI